MDCELERPVRPDHAEVKAQTMKLTEKMEEYAGRIEEIKELTADRKGKRAPVSDRERVLKKELNDIRSSFQSALRQKQSIRDELNKANQGREQLRAKLRQIKENSKITSVEEIDHQIKRLEEKINKTELSPEEQDECIGQIRQLVRSRETVRSLRKQLDSIQSDDNTCEDLMEKLKDVDSELDKLKSREKEVQKELDGMRREREEEEMDVSALIAEKQECWQILCALKEKKKEINDAFTERMNAFKKEEQQFRKQEQELRIQKREQERKMERERRMQREKEAEEKVLVRPKAKEETKKAESLSKEDEEAARKEEERKRAERRRRQLEHQRNRQTEKIDKCDYLMSYLTPLLPPVKQETPLPELPSEAVVRGRSPPEAGMKQLKKSEPEERDAWLMGSKSKKPKHKKSKKSTKTEKPEDKILMHSHPTLEAFQELKIKVPDTMADVPKALKALEELKEHYRMHLDDPPTKPKTVVAEQSETAAQASPEEPMQDDGRACDASDGVQKEETVEGDATAEAPPEDVASTEQSEVAETPDDDAATELPVENAETRDVAEDRLMEKTPQKEDKNKAMTREHPEDVAATEESATVETVPLTIPRAMAEEPKDSAEDASSAAPKPETTVSCEASSDTQTEEEAEDDKDASIAEQPKQDLEPVETPRSEASSVKDEGETTPESSSAESIPVAEPSVDVPDDAVEERPLENVASTEKSEPVQTPCPETPKETSSTDPIPETDLSRDVSLDPQTEEAPDADDQNAVAAEHLPKVIPSTEESIPVETVAVVESSAEVAIQQSKTDGDGSHDTTQSTSEDIRLPETLDDDDTLREAEGVAVDKDRAGEHEPETTSLDISR